MNYDPLNKIRIYSCVLMRVRERGKGKAVLYRACPLTDVERVVQLENHHFVTIIEKIGLENIINGF